MINLNSGSHQDKRDLKGKVMGLFQQEAFTNSQPLIVFFLKLGL